MKALIIASVANFVGAFETNNIKLLTEMGYEVHVAANFDGIMPNRDMSLKELHVIRHDIHFSRQPFSFNNLSAIQALIRLFDENHFDLIHCHTPVGGTLGRIALKRSNSKSTIIYTAHGFHFFKGAPIKNWLIFYPIEKALSRYTDILITINQEDYNLATKSFFTPHIVYIPGVGIDTSKFYPCKIQRDLIRKTYGLTSTDLFILSVGELSARKNHMSVLKALRNLSDNTIHYFIVGEGSLEQELIQFANEHNINLHLLGYRNDVDVLCNAADLFILPSLQEGLPVALMEALSTGCICICSNIRGNIDLVDDKTRMFDPNDPNDIANCILRWKKTALQRQTDFKMVDRMNNYFAKNVVSEKMTYIYKTIGTKGI